MIRFQLFGSPDLQHDDGTDFRKLLAGPKRLALLTYLSIAAPGEFHRRDTLLALLWPEVSDRQARGSLRNTLHVLRQHLGPHTLENRGADEVRIVPGAIETDVVAFRNAYAEERWADALDLYRGDLLPGFFVSGAPGFEDWLDRERSRLNRAAFQTAWALAEAEEAAGDSAAAARRARDAARLVPLDEEAVRRLIRLLDRLGDRAGALETYEHFAQRLAAELYGEPSPETSALIEEIRARDRLHGGNEPDPDDEPSIDAVPTPDGAQAEFDASARPEFDASAQAEVDASAQVRSAPAPRAARPLASPRSVAPPRRRSWRALVGTAGLVLISFFLAVRGWTDEPEPYPEAVTLAVGEIETFGYDDPEGMALVLPSMLSSSLARSGSIRVLSRARLHEILAGYDEDASIARAAREAGAGELLEGTLVRRSDDVLRLDLRRIDLVTGELLAAYFAEGPDPVALLERTAAELLTGYGPGETASAGTSRSVLAHRFYEEGLRAYAQGDNRSAQRLLSAALDEDSTFAMAAYYRALSHAGVDHGAFRDDLYLAARLADQAPDQERLLILAAHAVAMDDPIQRVYAESLAVQYPTEPDGHLFLGKSWVSSGEFLEALPHLRRVVEMDSMSLRGTMARCLACEAAYDIVTAYIRADSLPAAERTARWWTETQPGSARAWHALARTLEYQSRFDEARPARGQAALRRSDNPRDPLFPTVLALRAGDFARADLLLDELEEPGASLVQQNVAWYRVLSAYYQGRIEEALEDARRYTELVQGAETSGQFLPMLYVLEAILFLEAGDPQRAADLWKLMADIEFDPDSPARSARHRAWTLTHAAVALAAAGDTAALPVLADSIQADGARSAFGRDPRLHHFVRGLLFAARGDLEAAADAYRNAIYSPSAGFSRINFELGRTLLALGRPDEAAEVLSAALRGPLDGGNLYISRTEIHELAGYAWEAAGHPDSAAAHFHWVSKAWRNADPRFQDRLDDVRRRLARLVL